MIALNRDIVLEAVNTAVVEIMEAMFFDAAQPVSGRPRCAAGELVAVCLWFHDTVDGEFTLAAPLSTATALAASFLGLDNEQVDRTQAEQILCELANIICGSALSRLEPSSELRLSSPMITPRPCTPEEGAIYQHYLLLEGCFAVCMRID